MIKYKIIYVLQRVCALEMQGMDSDTLYDIIIVGLTLLNFNLPKLINLSPFIIHNNFIRVSLKRKYSMHKHTILSFFFF